MYKTNEQIRADIAKMDALLAGTEPEAQSFDVEPDAAIEAVKQALKESELLIDIARLLIDTGAFFEVDDELRARLEPVVAALEVASQQRELNDEAGEHYRYPELAHDAFILATCISQLLSDDHVGFTPLHIANHIVEQVDVLRKLTAKGK